VIEVAEGVRRVTLPLPFGIDHVHAYLLRGGEAWTLVDTGLGLPDAAERWRRIFDQLDAPLERIVITHFHPDHLGAAADVATLAGARVYEMPLDYSQCLRVWGDSGSTQLLIEHMLIHGTPQPAVESLRTETDAVRPFVRFARDPEPLGPGHRVDGWEVLHLPGHADGHLCLLRNGILIAGDTLLADVTPIVALYPEAASDPLADYLVSLRRLTELAPRIAFPGHGEPVESPADRAREIVEHHRTRLNQTSQALGDAPRSAYDVSLELFSDEAAADVYQLGPLEALAHLEHLVRGGRAERVVGRGQVRYRRP
jgi:glyoxylase-like metal-dependent hydrolase (beta-lactamase superfamily II)